MSRIRMLTLQLISKTATSIPPIIGSDGLLLCALILFYLTGLVWMFS